MGDKNSVDEESIYSSKIRSLLKGAKTDKRLYDAIVNAPFQDKLKMTMLDLGIIVLLIVNKKTGVIDRVALSDTEPAKGAVQISEKPFNDIKIPMDYSGNIISRAVKFNRPYETADWRYLFAPALSPESARFNQAGAGIGCSVVYPLKEARKNGGAMIFSFYAPLPSIGPRHKSFMEIYSKVANDVLSNS